MALFIFLTAILAIIALSFNIMFYEFGYVLLGDWSGWVGWSAVTFFIFAMIGISTEKVLKEIGLVLLKNFLFSINIRKQPPEIGLMTDDVVFCSIS